MAYLALYRKYRPLRFDEVVGQEFVTTALKHAVRDDRLAHAYLFSGPRGTGKTSTARIFARAINCEAPVEGEPCNVCTNCLSILAGQWGLIEIDGASHNRVEDMRALLDSVGHVPLMGQYNVYIIDEVHMLSNAAFNAFLKTLEEPPNHVKFILATTEPFKVPRTIHSRCQHYLFQAVSTGEVRFDLPVKDVPDIDVAGEWIAALEEGSLVVRG
ncbi:MAG: DNA polymerase III subunit gamma/tau, partial [bacterium]